MLLWYVVVRGLASAWQVPGELSGSSDGLLGWVSVGWLIRPTLWRGDICFFDTTLLYSFFTFFSVEQNLCLLLCQAVIVWREAICWFYQVLWASFNLVVFCMHDIRVSCARGWVFFPKYGSVEPKMKAYRVHPRRSKIWKDRGVALRQPRSLRSFRQISMFIGSLRPAKRKHWQQLDTSSQHDLLPGRSQPQRDTPNDKPSDDHEGSTSSLQAYCWAYCIFCKLHLLQIRTHRWTWSNSLLR